MDLKDFQIFSEDESCYSVGHPNGKKLTVEKSKLSEKAHALIKKLPKYAEGGQVEPDLSILEEAVAPQVPDYLKPNELMQPELGRDAAAKYFMNDQSAMQPNPANSEQIIQQAPVVGKTMADNIANNDLIRKATQAGLTVDEFQKKQAEPKESLSSVDFKPGKEAPVAVASPSEDLAVAPSSQGLEQQKQANLMEASAIGDQSRADEKAQREVAESLKDLATPDVLLKQFKSKDDALMQAYESKKIDPDRYIKNMDTGAKIQQGIALVLGGIGAGLTGGENLALKMLSQKIDADIKAQQEDKSAAMNLWKMNKESLGDSMAANLATQNQLYKGLQFKMMQSASKANSQVAMARAQAANAVIQQGIDQNNMKLSLIMSPNGGDEASFVKKNSAMKMFYPEMAKENDDKYIPGVGVASVKPTEKDRERIASADVANKQITELQALATQGLRVPGTVSSGVLEAKMTGLMMTLKTVEDLGVIQGADMDLLKSMIGSPGSMLTDKAIAQLGATKQKVELQKNGLIDKLGVKPFKQKQEISMMGGVQYMKVPGGWKKVQ